MRWEKRPIYTVLRDLVSPDSPRDKTKRCSVETALSLAMTMSQSFWWLWNGLTFIVVVSSMESQCLSLWHIWSDWVCIVPLVHICTRRWDWLHGLRIAKWSDAKKVVDRSFKKQWRLHKAPRQLLQEQSSCKAPGVMGNQPVRCAKISGHERDLVIVVRGHNP